MIDAATLDDPVDVPLMPPRSWFEQAPRDPDAPDWVREFDPRDQLIKVQFDGPEAGRFVALVAPEGEQILRDDIEFQTPESPTGYNFAHVGTTYCEDGSTIRTGNIGGNINHAPPSFGMRAAVDLYANTATKSLRCRYHDVPGVGSVAVGALWPGVTKRDALTIMGMAISGDWRHVASLRARDLAGSQLVNAPALRPLPHGVDRHPAFRPMRFRPVAASLSGSPEDVVFGEWVPMDAIGTPEFASMPLRRGGQAVESVPAVKVADGRPDLVERLERIEAIVSLLVLDEVQDERLESDDGDDDDYSDIITQVFGCKACHGRNVACPRCGGTGMEPYSPMDDLGYDMADEFADDDEAMVAALAEPEVTA